MAPKVEAEELAWVANSYLHAAHQLVEAVIAEKYDEHFYWSRAPLNLCYHAVELYYKAALAGAGTPWRKEHNLSVLRKEIAQISDCAFPLPTWLGGELSRTADLFEDDIPKLYFEHLHQQLRYVTDRKGRQLNEPPQVSARDLLEDIEMLQKASMPLFLRLAMDVNVNAL